MNWFGIIILTILVLATILLLIIRLNQWNFFFQVLYAFIYEHEDWKKYRRLRKYLKTNTIPLVNLMDDTGINYGFVFIQYDDIIFIRQGASIYLSSYYSHLIKNLLKCNNDAIRRALQ